MNRLFFILFLAIICQDAFCQQFAIQNYSRKEGLKEYRGIYKVNNGHIKHNYSCYINGRLITNEEESFSCNPNVDGEMILNIINALVNTNRGLNYLHCITLDNKEYENDFFLKEATSSIEDAVSYYEKATCDEGYNILKELYEELQKARKMSSYKEKITNLTYIFFKYRDYNNINCNLINPI